jgi:uncharacterized protein YecE (DUF72 family)
MSGANIQISCGRVKYFFGGVMNQVRYLVGVGGWEHEVFDECFYPRPKLGSAEKLACIAEFFDTVEVRQTFWDADLGSEEAKEWIGAVAGHRSFLFTVKLHSSFTHQRSLKPRVTRNIRGMLTELGHRGRLGALLAQFPYAFTNTSGNRYHLSKIGEIFRGFPVFVELRHESWHHASTRELLEENSLQPVSADLPRVKQFMPFTTSVSGERAYIRLHGRNEKGWLLNGYDSRYDYLYNGREIQELRRRCEALSQRCREVIIVCNNTTGGKAIASALQLRAALSESRKVNVPEAALRVFPHLSDVARHQADAASLFVAENYREAM